uniref:Uncharacterized protein n=1 Tax=Branchiostoma floridae TaxID=7739 RepID=C3YKT2_BRAFL|eukprot:XP_002603139.1 hypothetical protein BRAFLDRAFT_63228 [Branchiostoma floridae]
MARRWRHLLMFLLIILKEPNMPEAGCSCAPASRCDCSNQGLTSIPQNLPTSISGLDLRGAGIVLIGTIMIILTIWYKRRTNHPPLGPNPNVVGSNTNTTVSVLSSDLGNQYEDIDSHHDQTRQGQSQTINQSHEVKKKVLASLKPNSMYGDAGTPQKDPVSTNNHDQTGQGQSQANTQSLKVGKLSHDEVLAALKSNPMYAGVVTPQKDPQSASDHNQYEDIDSHHDQTGQGQSQAITESNTNTTATVVTSGQLQTGQGQSQAITESNTNITAAVTIRGHSQTQDRPITESLDSKRPQCSTLTDGPNSKLNKLYKAAGQYQTLVTSTTAAAVVPSGHDHQDEDMAQHNKSEQGPSQLSTKSNTNTTATAVTSDLDHQYEDRNQHDQTEHGQSHAITESLDARNFSYGSGPSASRLNSLYAN